jgi:hypothetical protein
MLDPDPEDPTLRNSVVSSWEQDPDTFQIITDLGPSDLKVFKSTFQIFQLQV